MLGILCGLSSEAKIAGVFKDARVACSAAVPHSARQLARGLVTKGATGLMSFGVAGALDTNLPVGAVIVGSKVAANGNSWVCDSTWANWLLKKLPEAHCCDVWGSETLVPTAAEKIGLYKTTGCSIVDMESQCAAEVAAQNNLPLAVVRVVCDIANHNVPPMVMAAINPDGSTNYLNVAKGLFKNPKEALDLLNVGRSLAHAIKVLDRTARQISETGLEIPTSAQRKN